MTKQKLVAKTILVTITFFIISALATSYYFSLDLLYKKDLLLRYIFLQTESGIDKVSFISFEKIKGINLMRYKNNMGTESLIELDNNVIFTKSSNGIFKKWVETDSETYVKGDEVSVTVARKSLDGTNVIIIINYSQI